MFSFLLHHIFSLKMRNLGIVCIIIIFSLLLCSFVLIYRNTVSLLDFYSPNTIDSKRVILTSESSFFDILSRDSGGIPPSLESEIESDEIFSRTRSFSFVDTNILGWFDIFSFHLDTDVPVFSLRDSFGELSGFGVSPSMLHYYNLELAWSHPMFPTLDEDFLRGKKVSLIFGASKMFSLGTPAASPLTGSIVSVDWDYPWFGIVASERQVESRLREIQMSLRQPYKIVAYMKDPLSRDIIMSRYKDLNIVFDQDSIAKRDRQYQALFLSLFGIWGFFLSIIFFLLFLLFSWYFRERHSMSRLAQVYGISPLYKHILIYSESYIFLALWVGGAFLLMSISQVYIRDIFTAFLHSHGLLFPVIALSHIDMLFFMLVSLGVLLFLIFSSSRKK